MSPTPQCAAGWLSAGVGDQQNDAPVGNTLTMTVELPGEVDGPVPDAGTMFILGNGPTGMTAYTMDLGPYAAIAYVLSHHYQVLGSNGELISADAWVEVSHRSGWVEITDGPGWAAPRPDWSATLAGTDLHVIQPNPVTRKPATWYTGELFTSAQWRAAAISRGQVLHLCGGFDHPRDLQSAVTSGRLRVALSAMTIHGG